MPTARDEGPAKGAGLIECVRNNYKDVWVTAETVRNRCPRGGSYVRDVLDEAAKLRVIEKKVEYRPTQLYKVDPDDGVVKCPIEPERKYQESICFALEPIIESCVQSNQVVSDCEKKIAAVFVREAANARSNLDSARAERLLGHVQEIGNWTSQSVMPPCFCTPPLSGPTSDSTREPLIILDALLATFDGLIGPAGAVQSNGSRF